MNDIAAARILELGAGLIKEHGWVLGFRGIPETGFCADGACFWAFKHSDEVFTYTDYTNAVSRLRKVVGGSVTNWNDYGVNGPEEVVSTMLGVAESLRTYSAEPYEVLADAAG